MKRKEEVIGGTWQSPRTRSQIVLITTLHSCWERVPLISPLHSLFFYLFSPSFSIKEKSLLLSLPPSLSPSNSHLCSSRRRRHRQPRENLEMVGLSIVLETQKGASNYNNNNEKNPQVINKATMIINNYKNKPSSSSSSSSCSSSTSKRVSHSSSFPVLPFLEHCFLCRQKLLPGKDIYLYKGDRAFCSVECRCRQIIMDEEESASNENCSLAAMKPTSASAVTSSSPSGSRHRNKGARNRAGGFAY